MANLPEAVLSGEAGHFGTHRKEDDVMWICDDDGSRVKATKLDEEPNGDAIRCPTRGDQAFRAGENAGVRYVQRLNTTGGKPTKPLTNGAKDSVQYTADYHFWGELPAS